MIPYILENMVDNIRTLQNGLEQIEDLKILPEKENKPSNLK